MNIIAFTKVKLPYGWLGNMSAHPITYDGKVWKTSEALFQARRFAARDPLQERIRLEKSPMSAKMLAKSNVELMIIQPMSGEDIDLMRDVLRLKIEAHDDLRQALVSTQDAQIIEDCTNRQRGSGLFWGAAKQADSTWVGQNWLGKLWMSLRLELINDSCSS